LSYNTSSPGAGTEPGVVGPKDISAVPAPPQPLRWAPDSRHTCEWGSELGRIGSWSGKVNIHLDASGVWQPDSDCTSGANIDPLSYCQKFWPSTASVAPVELTAKPTSVWYDAGCGTLFGGPGVSEFICVP
jgi:hypothetical protein